MFSKRLVGTAAVITAAMVVLASPATADDWDTMMDSHYSEAEKTKYEPKEGSEWGFSLSTMMNDMEWRKTTAAALIASWRCV